MKCKKPNPKKSSKQEGKMVTSILDTIGNTPLIELKNSTAAGEGKILFKYERNNPGGSIKDRPAIHIVTEAEHRGWLRPGGTIIESSSGNFGISLAMIGAAKGYHVIILVDPKTTETNLALLKCYGAEVIVVTEQDDSGSYHKTRISLANKLAREIPDSFRPDQCFSLLNSDAHYRNTAREIFADCPDGISAVVAAVSTGGQLGGISRYVKTYMPEIEIVGVDAIGSSVFGGDSHSYQIPGIGLAWTPSNIDIEHIDRVYKVSDEQAFVSARCFARSEGILMGPSSGACALVALSLARRLASHNCIVCIISDGGERYIKTLFDDEWMQTQGFTSKADIEILRTLSRQLSPWSTYPAQKANYMPELADSLEIPQSTRNLNRDIGNGIKLIKHTAFID